MVSVTQHRIQPPIICIKEGIFISLSHRLVLEMQLNLMDKSIKQVLEQKYVFLTSTCSILKTYEYSMHCFSDYLNVTQNVILLQILLQVLSCLQQLLTGVQRETSRS